MKKSAGWKGQVSPKSLDKSQKLDVLFNISLSSDKGPTPNYAYGDQTKMSALRFTKTKWRDLFVSDIVRLIFHPVQEFWD